MRQMLHFSSFGSKFSKSWRVTLNWSSFSINGVWWIPASPATVSNLGAKSGWRADNWHLNWATGSADQCAAAVTSCQSLDSSSCSFTIRHSGFTGTAHPKPEIPPPRWRTAGWSFFIHFAEEQLQLSPKRLKKLGTCWILICVWTVPLTCLPLKAEFCCSKELPLCMHHPDVWDGAGSWEQLQLTTLFCFHTHNTCMVWCCNILFCIVFYDIVQHGFSTLT